MGREEAGATTGPAASAVEPRREIGFFGLLMMVIGSVIGTGIFISPGIMLSLLSSPLVVLGILVVIGAFSLFQSLVLAELGARLPEQGGTYVYLREGTGRASAFLFAWNRFWIAQTGAIAGLALAFGRFAGGAFGEASPATVGGIAVGLIAVMTVLNLYGIRAGVRTQNVLTIAKGSALALLVLATFLLFRPQHSVLEPVVPAGVGTLEALASLGLVAILANSLYGGAIQVSFVGGEVRDPQRNLPRALWMGSLIVIAVYLVLVLSYVWAIPAEQAGQIGRDGTSRIAAQVAEVVLGPGGALFVTAAILLSILGAVHARVLSGPRVFYAAAKDGQFWHPFAKLDARHASPQRALIFQGEWAAILVCLSLLANDAFLLLMTSVSFSNTVFNLIVAFAYLRLDRRTDLPRPFVPPARRFVFGGFLLAETLLLSVGIGTTLITLTTTGINLDTIDRLPAIWGLTILALGLVVLWLQRRFAPKPKRRAAGASP